MRSSLLLLQNGQKGRNKKIDKKQACLHISSSGCRQARQVTKIESLRMIWMRVSRLCIRVLPQLAQRLTSFKNFLRLLMHELMHSTTHDFRSSRRDRLRSNLFSASQCAFCIHTYTASVSTEIDSASIICQVLNTYVAFTQTRSSSLGTANGVHTPGFTTRGGVTVHRYSARVSKYVLCLQPICKTFSMGRLSEMDASCFVDRFSIFVHFDLLTVIGRETIALFGHHVACIEYVCGVAVRNGATFGVQVSNFGVISRASLWHVMILCSVSD